MPGIRLCWACRRDIADDGETYFECTACTFVERGTFCADCAGSLEHAHDASRLSSERCFGNATTEPLLDPSSCRSLGELIRRACAVYAARPLLDQLSYADFFAAACAAESLPAERWPIDGGAAVVVRYRPGRRREFWLQLAAALLSGSAALAVEQDFELSSLAVGDAAAAGSQTTEEERAAVAVLTSGTSGLTRSLVTWSNSQCVGYALELLSTRPDWPPVVVDFQPPYHAFGLKQFVRVLRAGGRLALWTDAGDGDVFRLFAQTRPTFVGATPAFYAALRALGAGAAAVLGNRVQTLMVGGALPPAGLLQWMRTLRADAAVVDGYALTEAGTVLVNGRPHPAVEVTLAPDDGELCVRGRGVRIPPQRSVVVAGQVYLRTGDIAQRRADGTLAVVGRKNCAVKLAQGEFVQPEAIEAQLEQHADVLGALVWAAPDWQWPVCVLRVASEQVSLSVPQLHSLLGGAERRPSWELPQAVLHVVVADDDNDDAGWPSPLCGKKRRMLLWQRYRLQVQALYESVTCPAASPFDQLLQRVGLVGYNDRSRSFASCGGDSVKAAALAALLGVTPVDVYRCATLHDLERRWCGRATGDRSATAIDWQRECQAVDIAAPNNTGRDDDDDEPRWAFMTGCSGFMGPFILQQLLQHGYRVYCLVRSPERLPVSDGNVVALVGDLSLPRFGLSAACYDEVAQRCSCVVHNGAHVHGIMRYDDLKSTNVGGCVEALRLAVAQRAKHLLLVSSVNVLRACGHGDERELDGVPLDDMPGYAQSKFVGEIVVTRSARALLASSQLRSLLVYRPSTVCGDTASGLSNTRCFTNITLAGLCRLATASPQLHELLPARLHLIPVDYCARKMLQLHAERRRGMHVVHLVNPTPLPRDTVDDYLRTLGYALPLVDDEAPPVPADNPLHLFDRSAARLAVAEPQLQLRSSVCDDCPAIDLPMFARYVDCLRAAGLFPAPRGFDARDQRYRIEQWYPALAAYTFATEFVPFANAGELLDWRQAALAAGAAMQRQRGGEVQSFSVVVERAGLRSDGLGAGMAYYIDETAQLGPLPPSLDSVRRQLDEAIARLGGRVFVRLSDRSPKDAVGDTPWCCSGLEALTKLALSRRVANDVRHNRRGAVSIAVRRWRDDLGPREVRLFVVGRRLRAASQYFRGVELEWAPGIEAQLQAAWCQLEQLVLATVDDAAVDIAVDGSERGFTLVEVNPPPPISDLIFCTQADLNSDSFVFRRSP